ncbi:MAG: DUF1492 domain-containing protein [Clostridia bacterium]|nr:DUF1492 domain-containing protein [Clostridia bacterium]
MEQYASLKKEIQEKIEGVKDMRKRTVLRLRFIDRLPFRDIGIAMSYRKSQIYDIYDRAIKNVAIS